MKLDSLNRTGLKLGVFCAFVSGAPTPVALALPKEGAEVCGCVCLSSDGQGGLIYGFNNYTSMGIVCFLFNGNACTNLTPEGELQTGHTAFCRAGRLSEANISIRQSLFGAVTIFRMKRPRQQRPH
jgi:hypothetical protein